MKKLIVLNKKEGETPLFALENFRKHNPEYLSLPMTYAGRLDPMASGVLVILVGQETKNKEKYLALDKEYYFSVLFGFSTDTYDILGKVVDGPHIFEHGVSLQALAKEIQKILEYFKGSLKQKYPIYSSKTVNGKPLFRYAREGKKVEIPEKDVFIKRIKMERIKKINNANLLKNIEKRVTKVKGDFRQKEIIKIWQKKLSSKGKPQLFYIADFKIKCSSGTYVRALANFLGENMKIPALALSIKRTKIYGV